MRCWHGARLNVLKIKYRFNYIWLWSYIFFLFGWWQVLGLAGVFYIVELVQVWTPTSRHSPRRPPASPPSPPPPPPLAAGAQCPSLQPGSPRDYITKEASTCFCVARYFLGIVFQVQCFGSVLIYTANKRTMFGRV